jgi:hypothetical protein
MTDKCIRYDCNYIKHTNISNNNGTHCCYSYKMNNIHGSACQRVSILRYKEIMNTRLPKHDTYTIQSLLGLSRRCDWFINGRQLINISNTLIPKFIFLTAYKGNIGIKYLVNILLPTFNSNFVLIIASEDYTFPYGLGDKRLNMYRFVQPQIKQLLNCPYLVHMFVENLDTSHIKMSPIPLGLVDPSPTINIDSPEFTSIDFSKKSTLCLCRHRTRDDPGQWESRKIVNTLCANEWADFVRFINKELSTETFIEELKNAKFCLCIHGGGYDPCPRFFEAILYGAIPIIQHSPLDHVFKQFPVVFIDDDLTSSSLSHEFLMNKLEELQPLYEGEARKKILELLTLDHWWGIIQTTIGAVSDHTQELP